MKVIHPFIILKFFMINNEYSRKIFIINIKLIYYCINMVRDNWLLFLILYFSSLQYRISILGLFLLDKSETICQHPIYLIDSQKHNTHNSMSDCVKCNCYWKLTELLQWLIIQCKLIYNKYHDSWKHHFLELIFFLTWLF